LTKVSDLGLAERRMQPQIAQSSFGHFYKA